MVKAGIYLLARLHPALHASQAWFWTLLLIGTITMLLGAISALRYYDLKRILAYATVSQLGILVMLLAFHTEEAYTAAVVGILAHSLYKGPLFMLAGIIDHATGTRDIRQLARLAPALPWTAAAAILAGLSMAGFPPFFGFLAKETFLETLFHHVEESGPSLFWLVYGAAAVGGIFFVGYSLTLLYETFIRREAPDEQATVHHAPAFGFVVAPLALATIGTIIPFILGYIEGPLLSAPASAIADGVVEVHLALWHGFTPVFITSLIAIATGFVVFLLRGNFRDWLNRAPAKLNGARVFSHLYEGSYAVARWVTQRIQGGTLAEQASVVLLAAVFGVLFSLIWLDGLRNLGIDWRALPQWHEFIIAVLAILAPIVTVRARTRLSAIISIGVVGVTVTLFFVFLSAPDLALTQLLIEILTVVLLVLVFYKIPANVHPPLSRLAQWRNILVSGAVGLLGFFLVLVVAGRSYAPSISEFYKLNAVPAAHGGNIVNVILVDFRGFDTLGEITVLAIAALGGYALLRASRLRDIQDQTTPGEGD
jgi:NADH:ubiquinone oxidoreductase subunit 5 (subunit L)/multisubunit Na+/H+ antiporter MnhA subunit